VYELHLPAGIKDVNDLHRADPEQFKQRFEECIRAARSLTPGDARKPDKATAPATPPWPDPVPLGGLPKTPAFPIDVLPDWLRPWVDEESRATQTPVDLAGMLALALCGAALAKKYCVLVRRGWAEPTNLFTVVALSSGERKSTVFNDATEPVKTFEQEEIERMRPDIAQAQSERRMLEQALGRVERQAARQQELGLRERLREQAIDLARQLDRHEVPEPPQLWVDDATPEALASSLARQGGRLLVASPEGTPFEIAKGRYSEGRENFEVFLKGHAGDALRVTRIGRDPTLVDQPALSVAPAVQPDVVAGLAGVSSMRRRGFLARFLYSLPCSLVGRRQVAALAVPDRTARLPPRNAGALAAAEHRRPAWSPRTPLAAVLRGSRPRHASVRVVAGTPTRRRGGTELAGRLGE
jgi:replicative DNA helicase